MSSAPTPVTMWTISEDGWIISASGARLGRVSQDTLYLYDKRTRTNVPIAVDELVQLMAQYRDPTLLINIF